MRRSSALLSWKIVALLGLSLTVIVSACIFFFLHSRGIIDHLVKDRLRNEAAIAALNFTDEELQSIHTQEDMQSPEFGALVWRLKDIRARTPQIRFAYIMRRTADPDMLEFVVDADALSAPAELDFNRNGVVDASEEPGLPGDAYPIADMPALRSQAFVAPTTDDDIALDQWGYSLSGYAPIFDANGQAVAVLGLDMMAEDYASILQSIFSMQALLLLLLGGILTTFSIMGVVLRHRMDEMEHLDAERRWLLQLILHQVGTPLTIFKWGVESLQEMQLRLPQSEQTEMRENTLILEDGVSRLEHVAEVLLAADRIQEGSMQVADEHVSLRSVIDETVAGIQPRLIKRSQRVVVDMPEDAHLRLDRRLLGGVLRELLDNAMVYSPQNGVISIVVQRRNKHVELQVADQGAGIPSEDLSRVFERFSRGSNAGKYDPNGTGVGMYIAKGIIERFGGRISLHSSEGEGTTVTFTLPCTKAASAK
ncbi:MAG: HAMP domain-containing sensor histidine kinase [Candidatus Peribacteraceae bacterium]|nr:HAMP domain-containing sensor histidine kinase [Candidatus Peribacteraceae bacterium]